MQEFVLIGDFCTMLYNFAIVGFLDGPPSMLKKSLAWCAHLYTAFGLIAAAGIAVTIYHGDYFYAFVLMFLAVVVDATDGTFARAVKVKEVLPISTAGDWMT